MKKAIMRVFTVFALIIGLWNSGLLTTPSAWARPCCETCEPQVKACEKQCDADYGDDLESWENCIINECDPINIRCWSACITCPSYPQDTCCFCPRCGEHICGDDWHCCISVFVEVNPKEDPFQCFEIKELCKDLGNDCKICSKCGKVFCGSYHDCKPPE